MMAEYNYIDAYQGSINRIMRAYSEKLESGNLDRLAYANLQRTDIYDQPDDERKRRIEAEKDKLQAEHRADAMMDIEDAQRTLKQEQIKERNRLQRLKVKAATGSELVREYAQANGMLESDAKAELDDYAAVKRSAFDDTIADRYAALRNLSRAKDQDRLRAQQYADQEAERLQIKQVSETLKQAEYFANQHPVSVVDDWSIGENAVFRQIQGKFKE